MSKITYLQQAVVFLTSLDGKRENENYCFLSNLTTCSDSVNLLLVGNILNLLSFRLKRNEVLLKKGHNHFIFSCIDDPRNLKLVISAGIEWILDNDASNAAVLVASEAHSITLAIEGLLGVVFTVATLTDEAVDVGEVVIYIYI